MAILGLTNGERRAARKLMLVEMATVSVGVVGFQQVRNRESTLGTVNNNDDDIMFMNA